MDLLGINITTIFEVIEFELLNLLHSISFPVFIEVFLANIFHDFPIYL